MAGAGNARGSGGGQCFPAGCRAARAAGKAAGGLGGMASPAPQDAERGNLVSVVERLDEGLAPLKVEQVCQGIT